MRLGDCIAGRFELRARAGAGGMGEVFQALDVETGQPVALKVLYEATAFDRLEREARALAALHHPAIVRSVAHGCLPGGQPYIAMEWLEGEDLATLLRRRRLGVGEALSLVRRVAGALAEAHAQGLIHRDIKPANLFLVHGDVSQVRLLDFGIARFQQQTRMTRTGTVLGTPGYMAPEQARGDTELSPALDIFSLGCVLFEVLTGRPVFEGQHVLALLAKIIFMEAPALEAHCPEAPAALAALVARMLAKEPALRPRDGRALLAELEALPDPDRPSALEPASGASPGALTQHEQWMSAVVMIGGGGPPAREGEAWLLLGEVRGIAEQAGGRLTSLANGCLTVTFGGLGLIKDQVTLAARLALSLRAQQAGLPIALATGRSTTRLAVALGEALERAAGRLEQQDPAPGPRPVAMDDTTAALLDAGFDWRQGAAGPELWGERAPAEAVRTLLGKPTPCVGRDVELRMLEQALGTCVEEPCAQVVLVTAPAGAGKSRLAHEFIHSLRRRSPEVAVWVGRADSTRAGSSLHLLGQALRGALGLQRGEPLTVRREKLRMRLARVGTPDGQRLCEFLGELVEAPFPEQGSARLAAARQDVQLMAMQLQRAFNDFLLEESAARPVVLVLDDLHWGDAASVRFVDMALREALERPVFVLGLARPEVHTRFPELWLGRGVRKLQLRSLSRRASERLVQAALGEALAAADLERLVTQAEGNAFYLEELIRAVAEGQRALPDTAVAMVQSRLAGLEPGARRVLRAASLFGDVFWPGATAALLGGMPLQQTRDWLQLLVQQEVLVPRRESRFPGEEEFAFRHALLREGAYALLTEEDRALGHRLAGEWLEQHGESDALALAEHFEQGGALERAAGYFVRAAERASEADDAEAILGCVEQGLRCQPQGEPRGALLSLKAGVHLGREQYAETIALASEALELLPAGGRRWCMTFHHLFPAVAFSRPEAFLACARRFLEVPPGSEARGEYIRSGTWLSIMLELTGFQDAAHGLLSRLRTESAHLDPRDTSSWAYYRACEANHHHLGEERPWSCMRDNAESARGFEQLGLWRHRCIAGAYQGKALLELGDEAGAEAVLRENLAVAERRGETMPLTYARLYLARLLAQVSPLERLDEPEQLARAVIAGQNASLLGPAHGVLAVLSLRRGALAHAEAEARLACEWVRPFPAYSWDLLALRVHILLELGRREEALDTGEAALRELERLGLAGYGELNLRLAVVEAREARGQAEAARELLRSTLPRLRLRVEDVPDAPARVRYLTRVPTQARLLALAREWLGDEGVRAAGLEPEAPGAVTPPSHP
jgi:tetratricopeptide (TPR) repeat protein